MDKIRLQKLLFLFAQQQATPEYHFIPYRYGCYSYSANADMLALAARGRVRENRESFEKLDTTDYLLQLKSEDLRNLLAVRNSYGDMRLEELIRHTYVQYPFYAIRSEMASRLLTPEELQRVRESVPEENTTVLFTIGYEGLSLEAYLLRLLRNHVRVLVDVRHNPLSMKYGFSKPSLKKYCESIGIHYVHIPEVGIPSAQRQQLCTQQDYDSLFLNYCSQILPKTKEWQQYILTLLEENKRIALTCFEANICQCHRKHLAEALEKHPDFKHEVIHI